MEDDLEVLTALGFLAARIPCVTTFHVSADAAATVIALHRTPGKGEN